MHALIEKFKNLFKGFKGIEKKFEFKPAEKPQLKDRLIIGVGDISKSIRESNRFQARKYSRRYISFMNDPYKFK